MTARGQCEVCEKRVSWVQKRPGWPVLMRHKAGGRVCRGSGASHGWMFCDGCDVPVIHPRAQGEYFTLHDEVWEQAVGKGGTGLLCIGCVEERLGRELHAGDFSDTPLNEIHLATPERQSPRMIDRMTREAP